MAHSPSLFLPMADRETRVFCFAGFPRLNSSSRPLAFSNPWLALFQYQRLASSRFAGAPIPYKYPGVSTVGGDWNCELVKTYHFCKITHSIFSLCQPRLSSFTSPEIGLCVTLLQYSFRSRKVPTAQGKFALVLLLHCCFAVPCNTLSGVNRTSHRPVLIRAAETELRKLVAQVGCFSEELIRVCFVPCYTLVGARFLVQEGLFLDTVSFHHSPLPPSLPPSFRPRLADSQVRAKHVDSPRPHVPPLVSTRQWLLWNSLAGPTVPLMK